MMNTFPHPVWNRCVRLLAVFAFGAGSVYAQEKSVRPGINKPYENPDVNESVQRFESENREVFAKRKEIVAACKLKPGMAVADVGAGTGLFTRLFAAEVGPKGRVYAVDIARKFIEHVEKSSKEAGLNNVTGIVCTPTSSQLPPNSVDLVFLCDTYHHFEYPQKTMASIHRALRPGGQLILVDYRRIEGKTPDWLWKHLRAGQEAFTKEIEAAGFKVVDQAGFLKENYFVRFEKLDPFPLLR
jgi:ubiquinone/menaquinone biosynthesis C-methylase UbiE